MTLTPRRPRDLHNSKVVKLTLNDLLNAKPTNGWYFLVTYAEETRSKSQA